MRAVRDCQPPPPKKGAGAGGGRGRACRRARKAGLGPRTRPLRGASHAPSPALRSTVARPSPRSGTLCFPLSSRARPGLFQGFPLSDGRLLFLVKRTSMTACGRAGLLVRSLPGILARWCVCIPASQQAGRSARRQASVLGWWETVVPTYHQTGRLGHWVSGFPVKFLTNQADGESTGPMPARGRTRCLVVRSPSSITRAG